MDSFIVNNPDIATNTLLYIFFDLLCAGTLAGLQINSINNGFSKRKNRIIYWVLLSQSALCSLDAIWVFFDGKENISIYFNYLVNGCYFATTALVGYAWLNFIYYQLEEKILTQKKFNNILLIPVAVVAFLAFSAPWNNWLFSIDESNHYLRGPLYIVQPIVLYGFLVLAFARILYEAATRKVGSIKPLERAFIYFSIIPFIGGLFQIFYGGIPFLNGCMTMATTFTYLALQRERVSSQAAIIQNVSSEYKIIIVLDTLNGHFTLYRGKEYFDDISKGERQKIEKLSDLVEYVSVGQIYEDDVETFKNSLSLDFINYMLSKRSTYEFGFRVLFNGEYRYSLIKFVKPTDGSMDDNLILVGLSDIDHEIKREKVIQDQLEKAKMDAESANKAKSEFLFNMSHDIRTPMNAILGFTEMAKKYRDDQAKVDECLDKVESSGKHLLALINDILDVSRMENGKVIIDVKPINAYAAIDNFVTMVSNLAHDKNIDFKVKTEDIVHQNIYADQLHVNQVILNIVSNSIKYTNSGGSVFYKVREIPCENEGKATFEFVVSDTGIGMSPAFVEKIFESYSREQTAQTEKIQGTGLGMAITKQLIDLMGGTINIDSELGQGTTTTVVLNFDIFEGELEEAAVQDVQAVELENRCILLVEDNELNREIALDILSDTGAKIECAADGVEAVEKVSYASEGYYDLILMDVNMPRMNGYDATKKIRDMEGDYYKSVPIIAMTANAFEDDKQKALKYGMTEHLSKPIEIPKLLEALAKYL